MASAPLRVQVTREMAASAPAVFAVIADHERWPEWFRQLKRVEITGAPAGVDGQRRVTLAGVSVDEVFLAWDADRLFAFEVTHSTRPMARSMLESVEVEPLGEQRCRVTYTQAFEPLVWMKPVVPVMRRVMRRMLTDALAGLERVATA